MAETIITTLVATIDAVADGPIKQCLQQTAQALGELLTGMAGNTMANDLAHNELSQGITSAQGKITAMETAVAAAPSLAAVQGDLASTRADLATAATKIQNLEGDMTQAVSKLLAMEAQRLPPVPGDGPVAGDATIAALTQRVATLEGSVQVMIANKRRNTGTMPVDERCRTMGQLGMHGNTAPVYKKWCSAVMQLCQEHYPGARNALDAAKDCGPNPVIPDNMAGILKNNGDLQAFSDELYGLLLQQTTGTVWTAIDVVNKDTLTGLEAWRRITYGCNPQSFKKATEISHAIVRPSGGQSSDTQGLAKALVEFDGLNRAYEEAQGEPLEPKLKLMGLQAILTAEMATKFVVDLDEKIATDYTMARAWVDSTMVRMTASASSGRAQAFPMDVSHMGVADADLPPGITAPGAVGGDLATILKGLGDEIVKGVVAAVAGKGSPGKGSYQQRPNAGAAGKFGSKGGGKGPCHLCGKFGHLMASCPEQPSKGAGKGQGTKGGGKPSGPGGQRRGSGPRVCWSWRQNGQCPYGDRCKFMHPRNLPKSISTIEGEVWESDLGPYTKDADGTVICHECNDMVPGTGVDEAAAYAAAVMADDDDGMTVLGPNGVPLVRGFRGQAI